MLRPTVIKFPKKMQRRSIVNEVTCVGFVPAQVGMGRELKAFPQPFETEAELRTLAGEVLAGVAAKAGTTRLFENKQLWD